MRCGHCNSAGARMRLSSRHCALQIKAGVEALDRGEFAEVADADLHRYLEGVSAKAADRGALKPMARYRLSRLAEADLSHVLATQRGPMGRASAGAAMPRSSPPPFARSRPSRQGPATRDPGRTLRAAFAAFIFCHARGDDARERSCPRCTCFIVVRSRLALLEIVRVLHERMEPSRHLGAGSEDRD